MATANLEDAGLEGRVEVRLGPALESLDSMTAGETPSFDFFFIDADKPNNPAYLERCLKLARSGSVIVGDNVVRGGALADSQSTMPSPGSTGSNRMSKKRHADFFRDGLMMSSAVRYDFPPPKVSGVSGCPRIPLAFRNISLSFASCAVHKRSGGSIHRTRGNATDNLNSYPGPSNCQQRGHG